MSAKHPYLRRCDECDGLGYRTPRIPFLAGTNPQGEPPPSEWCDRCNRKGYVITAEGVALLGFISDHLNAYESGEVKSELFS